MTLEEEIVRLYKKNYPHLNIEDVRDIEDIIGKDRLQSAYDYDSPFRWQMDRILKRRSVEALTSNILLLRLRTEHLLRSLNTPTLKLGKSK